MTAPTAADLRAYLKAGAGVSDADLTAVLTVAGQLIADETATTRATVPPELLARCVLEVAAEMYRRRDSSTGQSQYASFAEGGTQPVRGSRDPLTQVRPILRRFVVPF